MTLPDETANNRVTDAIHSSIRCVQPFFIPGRPVMCSFLLPSPFPPSHSAPADLPLLGRTEQESPAMILLLSIANAAADAIPGLSHAPLPWEGPVPRRGGPNSRDCAQSSQATSARSSSSSSTCSTGFYRLPWYRRPLRSPPLASGPATEFTSRGTSRTSFPPLLGASPQSDTGFRLDSDAASSGELSRPARASLGAASTTFVPSALRRESVGAAGKGARESREGRNENGRRGRYSRGGERGRAGADAHADVDADADEDEDDADEAAMNHSVVVTTPSQAPTEDDDGRGSCGIDISPIQLTVEAAPTPPKMPLENHLENHVGNRIGSHLENSPSRGFLVQGVRVPEAPTEEAPPAPVSSPVVTQRADKNGMSTPDGTESPKQKVRELKAEVHRLKREMAAMAAGFSGRMSYESAKAQGVDGSPPPEETVKDRGPGLVPWQWCGGENGPSDPRHPSSNLSAEITAEAPSSPSSSTNPKSTRMRADDSWVQRRLSGELRQKELGVRSRGRAPRASSEVGDEDEDVRRSMTHEKGRGRRTSSSSIPPTPAPRDRGGVVVSAAVAAGHSPPLYRETPEVVANVVLSPPGRKRSSSIGVGPSPASGEKTIGGSEADGPGGGRNSECRHQERVPIAPEELRGGDGGGGPRSGVGRGGGNHNRGPGGGGRGGDGGDGGDDGDDGDDGPGSGHKDITVRPPPIFFPVQDHAGGERKASTENEAGRGEAGASKPLAVSSPVRAKAPPPASEQTPPPPDGAADSSVSGSAEAGPRSRSALRRRESVRGDTGLWRWVLAQRTENATVRAALISHGLPPLSRRRIWAAWAGVARPAP